MAKQKSKAKPIIVGKVYGSLRVLEFAFTKRYKFWKCLCDPEHGGCGNVQDIPGYVLNRGQKYCGSKVHNTGGKPVTSKHGTRKCTKCGREKALICFAKAKTHLGVRSDCKDCQKDKNRRYHKKNKEKILARKKKDRERRPKAYRDRHLKWAYGITSDTYEIMWKSQSGLCAICGKPEPTERDLCVDHDHMTGKVRELLCLKCNWLLGNSHDSITTLESAIGYLLKWKS